MVKNYPQVSVRLPPETRSTLTALSEVCGIPQWRIIVDAVNNYVRDQSSEARQSIQRMANGKSGRSAQRRNSALRPSGAANRKRRPES
jgi:predicted DNA-binding protein